MKKSFKDFIKNIIEIIIRPLHRDDVFSFKYKNEKIFFYLPYKRDWIQQQIIIKNTFYESILLEKVSKYIPNNSIILDIGSNIGNHLIYFSKILNTKLVYGFEPQKNIFRILERNISLNNIESKTKIYNIGLGAKKALAQIDKILPHNSGSCSITPMTSGNIKINKLDNLGIHSVDFVKIDTEGFEKYVLNGGKKLIRNNKPCCWVEIGEKNKDFVFNFFRHEGYKKRIDLGDKENYLFIPK